MEVSVVTPTYNRRVFIPILIEVYRQQTFPKEKMEWIILDDGKDSVEDLFQEAAKTIPNLRYIREEEKMRIGAKRNRLNQEAQGEIIIAMDDDDYYPPQRVQSVVNAFRKYPRVNLAGSSEMYYYYFDTKKIYSMGPIHQNHATNGTMAWRKSYSDTHRYDEHVVESEEESFLEKYRHPMIQLDPKDSILVMCHTDNTVSKQTIREKNSALPKNNPFHMKETKLRLKDIVVDATLRQWYETKKMPQT